MKKILHFEDDIDEASMYAIAFKKAGFDYKHYAVLPENENDLINLVLLEKPEVIISDIVHPHWNGPEMFKILSKDNSPVDFPFFILDNIEGEKNKTEESGDLGYYITSGNDPYKFVSEIDDLLEKIENISKN